MQRIAIFPGSFDPITKGHESIVRRAVPLFDRIVVAIGENGSKTPCFSIDQRIAWLKTVFENEAAVEVESFSGLTVEYCRRKNASCILRGLRSAADFEFEQGIGQMNRMMAPDIETVFLLCSPEYSAISSSVVREIFRNGGDVARFVPDSVKI